MYAAAVVRAAGRLRKATWAMIAWQLLAAALVVYIVLAARGAADCDDYTGIGAFCHYTAFAQGFGGLLRLAIVYFAVTAALGIVWAWSLPDEAPCPDCGRRGRTEAGRCRHCGHDFFPSATDTRVAGGVESP
ncbi:MAG: hypothetical protein QOE92_1831 [Chloroflexota bacterium]|jgi:hypothetical protein|nr:hypothetical protein [Chloroflexota bacterium]